MFAVNLAYLQRDFYLEAAWADLALGTDLVFPTAWADVHRDIWAVYRCTHITQVRYMRGVDKGGGNSEAPDRLCIPFLGYNISMLGDRVMRRGVYTPAPRGHIQVRPKEIRTTTDVPMPASFFGTAEEIATLKKKMQDAEAARQAEHDANERTRAQEHAQKMREVSGFLQGAREQLQQLLPIAKGPPGADADEEAIESRLLGRLPKLDEIVAKVLQAIPKAKNGESPLMDDIVQAVLTLMPEPEKGKAIDETAITSAVIDALKGGKVLKADHIDGLKEKLKQLARQGGYIHGGGVTALYAGTGVAVTRRADGNYTISSTGGGGSGYQVPTSGVVNGTNTVFVFASAPNVIVVDQGRPMQKESSDGTVNWTGTTTVTLAIAPNNDIFATA